MQITDYIPTIEKKIFGSYRFIRGEPSTIDEIREAEISLGEELPEDNKLFAEAYGDCTFFDTQIMRPNELYRFDKTCLEMEGFIPFAGDDGNYFAFDKKLNVVRCEHDPFGCGYVTDSFTDWIKLHFEYLNGAEGVYMNTNKEIDASWERMKPKLKAQDPKKWWQFWK